VQCKYNDNISATKYKHASSLVSHKTVKLRKIAMKKVEKYDDKNVINATNGNFFQTTIPISLPFPIHHPHSRSHSHEFSLCISFPWNSHGIPIWSTGIPVSCTPLMLLQVDRLTSFMHCGEAPRYSMLPTAPPLSLCCSATGFIYCWHDVQASSAYRTYNLLSSFQLMLPLHRWRAIRSSTLISSVALLMDQ